MHRWEDSRPIASDWATGPREARGRGRRRFPWELTLLATAIAILAVAFFGGATGPPQPQHPGSAFPTDSALSQASPAAPMPPSPPSRVQIPAIGVDAPVMDLAIESGGRLASPPEDDTNLAGWWARGPSPGTRGTSIVAGHVDVPTGPAVFYNLGALKPGMTIKIQRTDGSTAHFTITGIDVYSADDFPDQKVYADTGRPEIRLITCGGGFNKKLQRYEGNVVVSAHLTTP
ncbi:class F sortase [Streptomyces sp. NPDC018055]|uniref:class F sortase n=2 Tax=unclassified Streptomyces TaxID=2593676 RepID=UPI0037888FB6